MAKRALVALLLEAVIVAAAVLGYATSESATVAAAQAPTPAATLADAAPSPTASPTAEPTAPPTASPTPAPTATLTPLPTASPTPDPMAISNYAPLPKCADGSKPALLRGYDDWSRVLVDKTFSLSKSYVPPDLVSVKRAGFSGSQRVRAVMIEDLKAMRTAADKAGAHLAIYSSYRSYTEQVWTFGHWVNELGPETAVMSSARAGHSEHQLGLAIDFREVNGPAPWAYRDWAKLTIGGEWLYKHAWEYGFVLSYPLGDSAQVCYGYEPWHYRYVGRDASAAIHASGETLRMWLWEHQPDQTPFLPPTPVPTPIWTFGPDSAVLP
jgi:D-alanyl-D-alanine carboxypeptidase